MNGTPITELASDELKEQRRQQALRWLERPTFSLRTGMLVVTWVAVCIMLFKANVVMGVIALAITAHWLLIAPIIGGRIRINQKAQNRQREVGGP